ncbi:aminodeoxychorismate/anthranilate synthase component II [Candidatus Woesearchaeota archaeon]|nr:aminodeoxychorismate/anthranilate synthase component II [Candidatus Woesearchaeota archaeon]
MKILFIDNFDSFTYNLVDEFKKLDCTIKIYRNDNKEMDDIIRKYRPNLIVLSPGPSSPKEAGICIPLIKKHHKKYPILGICLGHQAIIEALGGTVSKTVPVHGKKATITHDGSEIFNGIENPFCAARYHSLHGSKIPRCLKIIAETENIVMAVKHKRYPVFGMQFHPESILTPEGSKIIRNILEEVK